MYDSGIGLRHWNRWSIRCSKWYLRGCCKVWGRSGTSGSDPCCRDIFSDRRAAVLPFRRAAVSPCSRFAVQPFRSPCSTGSAGSHRRFKGIQPSENHAFSFDYVRKDTSLRSLPFRAVLNRSRRAAVSLAVLNRFRRFGETAARRKRQHGEQMILIDIGKGLMFRQHLKQAETFTLLEQLLTSRNFYL